MLTDTVLYALADSGVATITLNDPDTRNALSAELLRGLIEAFERARDDEAVRCVVLASSHEKTFSSGANLGGFAGDAPLVHKHFGSERFVELFKLIGGLAKPTVCAAGGHVLAGALGIALACDLIVASEKATFGTPEINIGAFPFMIMALIYRNVPRKKANELLLLGERWSAQEALAAGIVNRVVPAEDFDAAVADWAQKLAGKSPVIMRLGKEAMRRQLDMPLDDALDYLRAQLTLALSTEDIVEGVTRVLREARAGLERPLMGRESSRHAESPSRLDTVPSRAAAEPSPRCCARWSRTCEARRAQIRLGGGEEKIARAARARKAHRARADRAADRRRARSRRARHPRPAALLPARDGRRGGAGRRRDHRLRQGRRPPGGGVRVRLHGDGRLDGDDRRDQGHAPARAGADEADPVRLAARLRRRARAGGGRRRCSPAPGTCSARRS